MANKKVGQYLVTNKYREIFAQAVSKFNKADYDQKFLTLVDKAISNLEELEAKRAEAGKLKLGVEEMAEYYSGVIASMLRTVSHMAMLSNNAKIINQVVGYTSFLKAKEYAGQERAMGAVGFGSGQFQPKTHKRFVSLIAQQNALLSMFKHFATPEQLALFNREMQASDVREIARIREIAVNSIYKEGTIISVTGSHWFDTATLKINRFKMIENKLSYDLMATAVAMASQSESALVKLLAGFLIVTAVTIAFTAIISRSITGPTKSITRSEERRVGKE